MTKSKAEMLAEARQEREYGPLGRTIDEILQHDKTERGYLVLSAIWWRIRQKAGSRGDQSLSAAERTFLAVRSFDAEVNNGGFEQYFYNSAGDDAAAALTGLKAIGAPDAEALLERAMASFPDGKPPSDRYARQMQMQQIEFHAKPVWDECDSQFYKLELLSVPLLAYTRTKTEEFTFP